MEAQLREYRARKAQEQARQNQEGVWMRIWRKSDTSSQTTPLSADEVDGSQTARLPESDEREETWTKKTPAVNSLQENLPRNRFLRFIAQDTSLLTSVFLLKLILWLVLFALFLHLEFAAVFVIATFFYIIYATLETRRARAPGEPSAYSVFNPNCEQIDGTLTAEQFEQELKYGIGSTKK
ncbi:uncharacterized protein [Asterias amurensis]|uniref:uncharacterized protein n=1 Tax=Asterias amurensis TaxID=7602 RepID=UPI003AB14792